MTIGTGTGSLGQKKRYLLSQMAFDAPSFLLYDSAFAMYLEHIQCMSKKSTIGKRVFNRCYNHTI